MVEDGLENTTNVILQDQKLAYRFNEISHDVFAAVTQVTGPYQWRIGMGELYLRSKDAWEAHERDRLNALQGAAGVERTSTSSSLCWM